MGLYKFMHFADRPKVEAGSLRFGRIRYYQLLEAMTGDSHIGDRGEGKSTNFVRPMTLKSDSPSEVIERLSGIFSLGPNSSGNSITITGGLEIQQQDDAYVFSMAEGDLPTLVSSMCHEDRASYAYDGCVEVIDRARLVSLIRGTKIAGLNVADHFHVAIDRVHYTDAVGDHIYQPLLPSVFRKSTTYSYQSEVRIALQPKTGLHPALDKDALIIQVNPEGLFVTRDIDVSAASHVPKTEENLEEALEILRSNSWPARSDCTPEERLLIRNAYWALRQAGKFQDDELDRAFLDDMPPFFLFNRLFFGLKAAKLHHES
ncbi:hypothetical protein [Sphingomonas sp. UYEF23]|uniref:hypothetical protein n=1 Tax=Sphingomonas sp. UYEF23 TaxID=1756408 RepID=UPI0033964D88